MEIITLTIKTIHVFNLCTYEKEVFSICIPGHILQLCGLRGIFSPYIGQGYLTQRKTMIVKFVAYNQKSDFMSWCIHA